MSYGVSDVLFHEISLKDCCYIDSKLAADNHVDIELRYN